jgi:uncharacterized protein YecE (DUF72 family)
MRSFDPALLQGTPLLPASSKAGQPSIQPAPHLFAGTSGWAYPTWKPGFYPPNVPAKKFLEYYATQLNSVEVNYTFRSLPTEKMLSGWLAATPAHFRFSFKAPQRITHFKRLANTESDLSQFIDSLGPAQSASRLGLLLFQLPPNFKADPAVLSAFLTHPALNGPQAPRIAFEFRNSSFFSEEIYAILRAHNAALCISETEDITTPEIHTATTHTSFRLRRPGGYTPAELAAFAERFTKLALERETYIYFKHEDEPTGALNAAAFLLLASTSMSAAAQ